MASYEQAEECLEDYLTGKLKRKAHNRKMEILFPGKPSLPKGKEPEDIGVRVQTSQTNDRMEREVIEYLSDSEYVRLGNQIESLEEFMKLQEETDKITYRILRLYYYNRMMWKEVASAVGLSISQCQRKRKDAITELQKRL